MLSKIKNQQGISLLVLIIMIVLVGIIAIGITAFLIQNIALSLIEKDRARALYLAEMGLSDSFWELKNNEKLYGPPTQPIGQIDQQTVNYFDGTSGTYQVPQPIDSIVSTGNYNGIVRNVKVGILFSPKDYVLFSGKVGDFDLANRCPVEGNVFVNGNVVVELPANIDTTKMKLYLPKGNEAKYEDDSDFPYISLESPPSLPSLDTYYYDSLLNIAQTHYPSGDSVWDEFKFLSQEVIFINGNLIIRAKKGDVQIAPPPNKTATVVVGGSIVMEGKKNITVLNDVRFISQEEIDFQTTNVSVGLTAGISGNLLYSNKQVNINKENLINGSIVSPQIISVDNQAVISGFVYAENIAQIGQRADINGSIWAGNFLNGTIGRRSNFIWRGDYIPSPLPRGIAEIESNFQLVANSWKEIR